LDLHGKCSGDFNKAVDLKSVVHKYSHIDFFERSQEILTSLPALLDGTLKPTCHVEEAVQATVQELIQSEDYKPRPKVDLDKLASDTSVFHRTRKDKP